MKKALLLLVITFLFFTLIGGTSPAVQANTLKTATVNVNILNVRSGPGLQYARITQVTQGTTLTVMAEQPGWVQVSLGSGKNGWVSSTYVTLKTSAPAILQPSLVAKVTVSVLNVRTGPGTQYSRLTTVPKDAVLPVIKRQGDWLQVRLSSGQSGWIAGQYTEVTEAPAKPATPVANTPAPAPAPAPSPAPTPAPAPAPAPTAAVVNVAALNVRSGPGTNHDLIAVLSQDTYLTVLQKQGDWLQVLIPTGQTGWIMSTYVSLVTQPVGAEQPAQPAKPEVRRLATVNTSSLNARSGPGTDFPRVALLPQGTTLPIVAEQGDWLQVRLLSGENAWIAGWYVSVSTQEIGPSPSNPGGTVSDDVYRPVGPSPLAGKIIVIDPGHGGSNPGAIGITGLYEKVVTLDVSLRLANKLRQAGAMVVMTRDADTTLYLADRVTIAEAAKAHAFVSIHANSHPDRNISGTETYYYRGKPNDVESYYLAAHLQNELAKALGLRDIGVKHGNFHVIRETTMPASLVELAFLSNSHDESLMKTDQFREKAAQAIFLGLERFFQF